MCTTLDAHLWDVITILAIAAIPRSEHLIYATMEYAIDFATTKPANVTTVNALVSPPLMYTGSQADVSIAAPSYVSILRSASSSVLLALDAYANNVIAQHEKLVIAKYLNINPPASAGTDAVQKASAIRCSSSTVSMRSTQVQVSNSDSTIQKSGCVGLTSCVNCGARGMCRSSGCDTSMIDDACQTKVGAGAKCALTIVSASNNFSVTTCIAAVQQVSPVSSADTSNKENKLSIGAIAGIYLGALVFVAAVAVIVIAIVKRRALRQRNPR